MISYCNLKQIFFQVLVPEWCFRPFLYATVSIDFSKYTVIGTSLSVNTTIDSNNTFTITLIQKDSINKTNVEMTNANLPQPNEETTQKTEKTIVENYSSDEIKSIMKTLLCHYAHVSLN